MRKIHQVKSYKQLRIANMIKLALIDVLHSNKLHSDLFECKITITKVVIAGQGLYHCYILPFSSLKLSQEKLMHAINASLHIIRRMVTQKINLKYSPELKIFYDHGFDNAADVKKILKSLQN
ncbi:ribosome-binding factor A family protein [Orientia chuto str. Dubai]|uniref:Ribosome-binding factor A n=1 Tax=Orientia chuto str. Dubai TaxID=1359168 RepID=A0A0F3MJ08_9RICK|nr:30S ribosome-binding factor RbfA [Candidatus Orientia mediorientalis]KJV55730.1 ribosome-binding factor A family protein [Orientia chuto str. Dubai]